MRQYCWGRWVSAGLIALGVAASALADGYIVKTARGGAVPNGDLLGSRGDYTITVTSNFGFAAFGTRERFGQPCAVEVQRVIGRDGGYDGGIERGEYGGFDLETVRIDSPCKGRRLTAGVQEIIPVARLVEQPGIGIMRSIRVCTSGIGVRRGPPSIKGYRISGLEVQPVPVAASAEHIRTECLNQGTGERAEWSGTGCGGGALPTALYLHFSGDRNAASADRLVGLEVGCSQARLAYVHDVGQGWDELQGRVFTYQIRHIIGHENPVGGGGVRN